MALYGNSVAWTTLSRVESHWVVNPRRSHPGRGEANGHSHGHEQRPCDLQRRPADPVHPGSPVYGCVGHLRGALAWTKALAPGRALKRSSPAKGSVSSAHPSKGTEGERLRRPLRRDNPTRVPRLDSDPRPQTPRACPRRLHRPLQRPPAAPQPRPQATQTRAASPQAHNTGTPRRCPTTRSTWRPDPRIHPSSLIRLSKRTPHDGQGCVKLLSANDHRSFPKLIMTRVDRDGVKRLVTGAGGYVHISLT